MPEDDLLQGLIFLGLVLLVVGPIHWYLWRRLVKDTTQPGRARRLATIGFLMLPATLLSAFILPRVVGTKVSFALSLIGYLWLALLFYLLLTLLALEVPRQILLRMKAPFGGGPGGQGGGSGMVEPAQSAGTIAPVITQTEPKGVERRLVLSRGAAIFAGLTAVGLVGYGTRTALGPPVLKRVQIPLSKLPRGLDGYKIALVSDIHLGPLTGVAHTRRIVDSINGMSADMIAVVGDLVDGSVEELRDEAAPLRDLRSRDGAFFVTGNHEYFSGAEEWLAEVGRLGLRPLRNERLDIRGLDLAGVDDVTGGQMAGGGPDFVKALGDRDLSKPVILLAHQPVVAFRAAKYKVDLQLSGHTHGGQMKPFNYIARLQQPIISGLGDVDGTKVYVTNGAGFWGPPVRVGAPPDITLVELRAA
ncbi:MAG TPA: metallophosphoesterase [Candidatus Limnocylindrales bacterium]|nr:metallophosphoesterase [Candidatus Limnocylindrales bacterium]